MEQHAGRAGKSEDRLVSVSGKGAGSTRGLGAAKPRTDPTLLSSLCLVPSCTVRAGDRIPADSSHLWDFQGLPSRCPLNLLMKTYHPENVSFATSRTVFGVLGFSFLLGV